MQSTFIFSLVAVIAIFVFLIIWFVAFEIQKLRRTSIPTPISKQSSIDPWGCLGCLFMLIIVILLVISGSGG